MSSSSSSSSSSPSITYRSTRGTEDFNFEQAILQGLAPDQGLFVPTSIPSFSAAQIEEMRSMSFPELSFAVISQFVRSDQIPSADLRHIINESFSTFRNTEVTPCVRLADCWIIELFHGPAFAVEDIALQLLGNLLEYFLARGRHQRRVTLLGATSGDTGCAAIQSVRGKKNVQCFVIFPYGKVTEIQERQMTTVSEDNVSTICVRGDFDDAQDLVKQCFADESFRDRVRLGAINSTNWARILAQIAYFFYAWLRVSAGHKKKGDSVSFCVPTGNFGDALAGYYAKRMGLRVDKVVVCTNQNQALHRFFVSGVFKRSPVTLTLAPSMDVSVPLNLERYLFYLAGESPEVLSSWMAHFEDKGEVRVPRTFALRAREDFVSSTASKQEILAAMRDTYLQQSYLLCPHTASAVHAARTLGLRNTHTVVLATAHPAKFDEALALALPDEQIPPRPLELDELFLLRPQKVLLPTAAAQVKAFVLSRLEKAKALEPLPGSAARAETRTDAEGERETETHSQWWWAAGIISAAAAASAVLLLRHYHLRSAA